jgi:hypothetical protein
MHVNRKMIPAATIPGMGVGIKENGGKMNSSIIHLIYCKNLHKCHNVPPPSTIKK